MVRILPLILLFQNFAWVPVNSIMWVPGMSNKSTSLKFPFTVCFLCSNILSTMYFPVSSLYCFPKLLQLIQYMVPILCSKGIGSLVWLRWFLLLNPGLMVFVERLFWKTIGAQGQQSEGKLKWKHSCLMCLGLISCDWLRLIQNYRPTESMEEKETSWILLLLSETTISRQGQRYPP